MFICQLEIDGFRGIKSAKLQFQPHTVLLGPNAVGKSAIVDALGLLFGRERLVRPIGDHDFFGSSPQPESRIKIIATISGFKQNNPDLTPQWFNQKDGGIPLWWNPVTGDVSCEMKDKLQLCCQIAFSARFDEDTLEYETARYFYDGEGDPFEDSNIRRLRSLHLKELGFFLLPSNRTWDRVISFASDLFKKVLKLQESMPGKAIKEIKEWLKSPPIRLEDDDQLKSIIQRVNDELSGFIGKEESVLQFFPTTGDVDGIMQALFPYLRGKKDTELPLGRHGSGIISLQTLLLLFEFGRARNKRGENFILATEEPELHLHPGHHRRLVGRIRGVSNQSITTTHSPEVVAYFKPEEITILRNNSGNLEAVPLLSKKGTIPEKNALMRLYTIYRSEICNALMHRIVLTPEGLTEFRWFNSLLRACVTAEGWNETDDSKTPQALAMLPTQDSHVVATYEKFQPYIECLIPIVDGDKAGGDYVKSLLKLTTPPSIIIQLPEDCAIEALIAWILSPEKDDDWEHLEEILGLTERSMAALIASLEENKTRWSIHEDIIAIVTENPNAAKRARLFLDNLSKLADGSTEISELWNKDEDRSSGKCNIWRFLFDKG